MQKKPVNDIVSKEWASKARKILTGCSPTISDMFTKLLTLEAEQLAELKTSRRVNMLHEATEQLWEFLRYGWTFGLCGKDVPSSLKPPPCKSPRVRALARLAYSCGHAIGVDQAAKLRRADHRPAGAPIARQAAQPVS